MLSSVFAREESKITFIFISTAIILLIIGSSFGTYLMYSLSSLKSGPEILLSHPYFQLFGFIEMFVFGVSYSLLPRFAGRKLEKSYLSYLNYALLLSYVLSNILSYYLGYPAGVTQALLLSASVVYSYQVYSITSQIRSSFVEANKLFLLSSSSLALYSLFALVLGQTFSMIQLLLFLVGFVGSMIYAIDVRSVAFRQSNYRKSLTNFASITQLLSIIFLCLSYFYSAFILISIIFFMLSALEVLFAIRIIELAHPLMYTPAMTRIHLRIKRYNETCLLSSSFWLLFGLVVSFLNLMYSSQFFNDLFIHSLAIGFIGSTIICYAPMFLPGILGSRGPVEGLSYLPIFFLNAGLLVRAVGDLQALSTGIFAQWEWFSGVLVILSILFLLHSLYVIVKGREMKYESQQAKDLGSNTVAEIRLLPESENIPTWFVYSDGKIFIIPDLKNKEKVIALASRGSIYVNVLGTVKKQTYQQKAIKN